VPYLWELDIWPDLFWSEKEIITPLSALRYKQGRFFSLARDLGLHEEADVYLEESYSTSIIEGEIIDKDSLRSSIANRLGLPRAGLPRETRQAEGIVALLVDATADYESQLTKETLCAWQAALFPTGYSGIKKIETGTWRTAESPMQIISGSMGKERVHFTAPSSALMENEMSRFISWWNHWPDRLDGILRAALAHLWFVTIHPFEDGNGRIARALTDRALAQDEKSSKKFYSLSGQIIKNKKSYYQILEEVQSGGGDITPWILWFLNLLDLALDESKKRIKHSQFKKHFYQSLASVSLNSRQRKVLEKLLEKEPEGFKGGLTNKKYVSMTKTSSATAKRDLQDLLKKNIIEKNEGGGRSVSYRLRASGIAPANRTDDRAFEGKGL